jgi:hypothetical protein
MKALPLGFDLLELNIPVSGEKHDHRKSAEGVIGQVDPRPSRAIRPASPHPAGKDEQ